MPSNIPTPTLNGTNGQPTMGYSPLSRLSAMPSNIPNAAVNGVPSSIANNGQTITQPQPQKVRIQAPNVDWTVDASSTLDYSQASHAQNAVSSAQNMFTMQATTSTQSNAIPHQMIARQPERTRSMSTRPNRLITINPFNNTYDPNSVVINESVNLDNSFQQQIPLQQIPLQQIPLQQRPQQQIPPQQRPLQQGPLQQRPLQQRPLQQRPLLRDRAYTMCLPSVPHWQYQQNMHQHEQLSQQAQANNHQLPSVEQQPVFYCLGCSKTANIVCRTCRNYCSCSEFCYDLIAAKHMNECTLPNIVSISNLLN